MCRTIFSTIVLIQVLTTAGIAQNPEWIVYDTSNSGLPANTVRSLAIDANGVKWIGLEGGGLVTFDGDNWTVYDETNSGLPDNSIYAISIDSAGVKWIGTVGGGLIAFDGVNWIVYNESNSGLQDNTVFAITIDDNGVKWLGTHYGLVSFDGTTWTVYNTSNSGLQSNYVQSITIDDMGTKWILNNSYVVSFDGTTWSAFSESDFGFSEVYISSLTVDNLGTKWIGFNSGAIVSFDENSWDVHNAPTELFGQFTDLIVNDNIDREWIVFTKDIREGPGAGIGPGIYVSSLASFNGSSWSVFDSSNSALPPTVITSVVIDDNGNKWIGTWGGLVVFNEGSVVGLDNDIQTSGLAFGLKLNQNFPNPFNPTTTISYDLPEQSTVTLAVFDMVGREVMTLEQSEKPPGNYAVRWNGMDQSGNPVRTGVYFARLQAGEYNQTIKMVYIR